MDLDDLLGTAGTLSSLLRGMVSGSDDLAEQLGANPGTKSLNMREAISLTLQF